VRPWLTLPNLISLARIPLAIAFLLSDGVAVRLALIAAAGLTDFLDGWLARRGRGSSLGAILDPITDKTFLVTALISLAVNGPLNLPELAVLLARDIAVALGFVVVLLRRAPVKLSARMPGKVVTVLQLAALFALVLLPTARLAVVAIVGIASAIAIYDYGRVAVRGLRSPAPPR
jgi:phosphatidylglycerophosphate synthase